MMKNIRRFVTVGILSLFCVLTGSPASANCSATDCVPRENTVYDVEHTDLTTSIAYVSIYLGSYGSSISMSAPTPQDGAAGLFLRTSKNSQNVNCSPSDDNGGSILVDAGDIVMGVHVYSCFYRQNINGDLRQWGITKGSVYDAGAMGAAATDVNSSFRLANILGFLANAGFTQATTSQVSVYIATTLNMPITTSLSCDATGGEQISGGNYLGHPGTIFLKHGAYINFTSGNDSSFIQNCLILPSWLEPNMGSAPTNTLAHSDCMGSIAGGPSAGVTFNYPFTSPTNPYDDVEAIRANMIICGDIAVAYQSNSGGTSHDVWAYGFDNPFYFQKSDHSNFVNSAADGDICYYSVQGGGNTRISNSICDVTLTKSPMTALPNHNDGRCIQVDSTHGALICNSEYWQIYNIGPATGIPKNSYGRDNCELTLVAGQAVAPTAWENASGVPTPPPVSLFANVPTTPLRMAPPLNTYNSVSPAPGDPINYPMWVSNLTGSNGAISCLGHGPYAIQIVGSGTLPPTALYPNAPYYVVDLLESEYGMNDGVHNDVMSATATWDQCLRPPCTIRNRDGERKRDGGWGTRQWYGHPNHAEDHDFVRYQNLQRY